MARTVDPVRHEQRRLQIIDAALTRFAEDGYAGATTAAICRTAGIGSGTFFHYFPTKSALLVAILEYGTAETTAWFAARRDRDDARRVLLDYVAHTADELTDPRLPGFVRAVASVMGEPDVAVALAADERAQRRGIATWVRRAQRGGEVRTDLSASRLADWVFLLVDGFTGRLASDPAFSVRRERGVLLDAVDRLLAP
ncbi:TetR/AcrR family transcriptional regulator [Nocardioides humi]|uniref:HTH tetR-type domain-containing protein n=1 Tax=Nocardioides humi TaxID=449461 RepID=A0ABN2AZX1_9ACTN|nr:TetR/AcrR family transcriptional regulator [Nocardioides humi]